MELQLILDSQLVDVLPLPSFVKISAEQVNEWKLILIERNHEAIALAIEQPQFVLEGVPSRVNRLLLLAEAGSSHPLQDERAQALPGGAFNGMASTQTDRPN